MDSSRKLPKNLDNPIDNFILDYIVEPINPLFYKIGMTPNKLTGVSGIFGLLSVYCVYKSNYILASLLYAISYIFDCFDGNFARKYNMVTEFGDWFDHIKDNVIVILLIIALYNTKKDNSIKIITFIIFIIFTTLTLLYVNEQERYYHSKNDNILKSESLEKFGSVFKNLTDPNIPPEDKLKYLRYFGCGSFNLYICLVILLFK